MEKDKEMEERNVRNVIEREATENVLAHYKVDRSNVLICSKVITCLHGRSKHLGMYFQFIPGATK